MTSHPKHLQGCRIASHLNNSKGKWWTNRSNDACSLLNRPSHFSSTSPQNFRASTRKPVRRLKTYCDLSNLCSSIEIEGPFSSFFPSWSRRLEEKSESINSSNYKSINKISNIKHRPKSPGEKHKKEWMIDQSTLNNRMEFMFSLWAEDVIYDSKLQMQSGDVAIGTSFGAQDGMCNQFPLKPHSKVLFLLEGNRIRSRKLRRSCNMHGKLMARAPIAFNLLKDLWYIKFNARCHVSIDFVGSRAAVPPESGGASCGKASTDD